MSPPLLTSAPTLAPCDCPNGPPRCDTSTCVLTAEQASDAARIRRASLADIRRLVELEDLAFTSYYREHRFTEADFRRYLTNPCTLALVVVRKGELLGYILGVIRAGKLRHIARVHSVAVTSTWRRKGLGARLLRRFIREARARACTRVLLEVAAANKPGLEFFFKLRFKKVRSLPGYYGSGMDGVRMQLE